jgi:hypothetical protein
MTSDKAEEMAQRKQQIEQEKVLLKELGEKIEAQGGKADENKEYNKAALSIQMKELDQRKKLATNRGAKEEIEKERQQAQNKQNTVLQKIAGGIGGILGNMKEKALAAGKGLMSILKGTLFAGLLIAVAKWLNSPAFAATVDYITNTLLPMITNFYEKTLKPFVLGIGKFFKDPSWENFKNIFDVENPLGLVLGLAGLTALFAPKLLFKGLKLGVKGFAKALALAGTGLTDLGSDVKKDAKGRTRSKTTGAFAKAETGKLSGVKNLGKGLLRGAKFLPVVGVGVTALMGLFDGVTAGLEEAKNENATKSSILRESIAGIGSGLTFGLVSQETISKGITSMSTSVVSGFNATKTAFTEGFDSVKAGNNKVITDPEGAFNAVSSKLGELTGLELPNFDETKAAITKFGNDMKTKFTDITGVEIPSFDEVKNKLTNLGTNLAAKFEGLTGINLGDKFDNLKEMLPDIGNPLKGLADGLEKADFTVFGFDIGKKLGSIIKSVTAFDETEIEKRAQGGKVKAGSMYLVNERGSELFVPDQPGQMISAERTASMMRSGNMANNASQTPVIVQAPTVNTRNQNVSNSTSSVNYIGNPDPIFQRASAFAI